MMSFMKHYYLFSFARWREITTRSLTKFGNWNMWWITHGC